MQMIVGSCCVRLLNLQIQVDSHTEREVLFCRAFSAFSPSFSVFYHSSLTNIMPFCFLVSDFFPRLPGWEAHRLIVRMSRLMVEHGRKALVI